MNFAQIVILKKSGGFDEELTYIIPDDTDLECKSGCFAEVPFRSQNLIGIVTEVKIEQGVIDLDKIKSLTSISKSCSMDERQIRIARFISTYYKTSMARALKLFLPKQIWSGNIYPPSEIFYRLINTEYSAKGEKQKILIDAIKKNNGEVSQNFLKDLNISSATTKALIEKGVVEKFENPIFKKSEQGAFKVKKPEKTLTPDQTEILDKIEKSEKPILLHGITGSGKTEIYLRRILSVLEKGKQVIYMVPEIALTSQTINYFKDYVGDNVAIFHSKLSDGQRAREWWKVKSGNANLIIGSRSAVFAPVSDLGLIILDEEHEWTYKQESAPYYQTHRVAEEMQKIWNAELILGSATPKAESYEKAKNGIYEYLELNERINKSDLPKIQIIDLCDEFKKRNFSIFSLTLQNKIRERLANNEQIILFVNQRGVANAVVCRECGYTEKCPNCDISLKLHRAYNEATTQRSDDTTNLKLENNKLNFIRRGEPISNFKQSNEKLVCHYCNYNKSPELLCPECRSPYIKNVGIGTQRVEEDVKKMFPQARVVRADRDTTENSEGFSPIYKDFLEHKFDILVGTQMIAKGLDFSKVSLIGIILADIGLHIPDFRSSERLFQILTQVAGRCGRGDKVGEVILQTYNPEHPTLKKAANYEYSDFIENELKTRSQLGYPPFNKMIKFTVVGSDVKKLSEHIKIEQEALEDIFRINNLSVKIISAPAMMPKIANQYYYHVLLRSLNPEIVFKHWKPPKGWRIDVDPVHTT